MPPSGPRVIRFLTPSFLKSAKLIPPTPRAIDIGLDRFLGRHRSWDEFSPCRWRDFDRQNGSARCRWHLVWVGLVFADQSWRLVSTILSWCFGRVWQVLRRHPRNAPKVLRPPAGTPPEHEEHFLGGTYGRISDFIFWDRAGHAHDMYLQWVPPPR